MVVGMAVMVLFNFLNVIFRYLLPQTPFSYTEELVVLIFIWVSLFGISYGYRVGAHTVLTIVSDRAPCLVPICPDRLCHAGIRPPDGRPLPGRGTPW